MSRSAKGPVEVWGTEGPGFESRQPDHSFCRSDGTRAALHTIDGRTFGRMPHFGSGRAVTAADWAQIPDYVSVTTRDSGGIAGYVKETDMLPLVNGQPMMNANV